jgi:hypothetical protein
MKFRSARFPANRTREGKFYLVFQLPDKGDGFAKRLDTSHRAETNRMPITPDAGSIPKQEIELMGLNADDRKWLIFKDH